MRYSNGRLSISICGASSSSAEKRAFRGRKGHRWVLSVWITLGCVGFSSCEKAADPLPDTPPAKANSESIPVTQQALRPVCDVATSVLNDARLSRAERQRQVLAAIHENPALAVVSQALASAIPREGGDVLKHAVNEAGLVGETCRDLPRLWKSGSCWELPGVGVVELERARIKVNGVRVDPTPESEGSFLIPALEEAATAEGALSGRPICIQISRDTPAQRLASTVHSLAQAGRSDGLLGVRHHEASARYPALPVYFPALGAGAGEEACACSESAQQALEEQPVLEDDDLELEPVVASPDRAPSVESGAPEEGACPVCVESQVELLGNGQFRTAYRTGQPGTAFCAEPWQQSEAAPLEPEDIGESLGSLHERASSLGSGCAEDITVRIPDEGVVAELYSTMLLATHLHAVEHVVKTVAQSRVWGLSTRSRAGAEATEERGFSRVVLRLQNDPQVRSR